MLVGVVLEIILCVLGCCGVFMSRFTDSNGPRTVEKHDSR